MTFAVLQNKHSRSRTAFRGNLALERFPDEKLSEKKKRRSDYRSELDRNDPVHTCRGHDGIFRDSRYHVLLAVNASEHRNVSSTVEEEARVAGG